MFTLGLDYDRNVIELNMKWVPINFLQSLIIIGLQLLQTTPLGLFEVITVRDWTKWQTRGCLRKPNFWLLYGLKRRCNMSYYDYQLSKAGGKFVENFWRSNFVVVTGNWLRFQWRLVGFDVNGSKVREIVGDDIVTIGNKESCPW